MTGVQVVRLKWSTVDLSSNPLDDVLKKKKYK